MTVSHPTARWMFRVVAALLVTVIGSITLVGTAAAHTELTGSDPTDGATLTAAPRTISLTFNEPLTDYAATIIVTGPDGQQYPTTEPVVDGAVASTELGALGPSGAYTVAYRVVSGDGHPVPGQLRFQLSAPAATSTAAPTTKPTTSPLTTSPGNSSPAATATMSTTPTTSTTGPVASTGPSASSSTVASGSTDPVAATTDAVPTGLAATSSDGSGGPSGWVWVVSVAVIGVLIAAAGTILLRQRRRGQVSGQ